MSNPLQIVDISLVDAATAEELLNAATSQGFLFVEGHDFEQSEVDHLFELSRQFFELPSEYKQQYSRSNSNHGYVDYGGENLDPTTQKLGDPKEGLNFSGLDFLTGLTEEDIPQWFKDVPERHELVVSTIKKMYQLSIKILRILAIGLKIEDTNETKGSEWFASKYDPSKASGSTFRLLHYPGQKSLNPEAVIRAGAHTDYGSMTLLFQKEHQEGLEIYSPVSKGWEAVPYVSPNTAKYPGKAPPIVVNIGDQLSYWSAGLLRSTIHRVKFPKAVQETGQDRLSIVFFSHPNDDALLTPFPSPLTKDIKGRGANKDTVAITAKQHLDKRLAATYK
ncbi:Clavaminate synthase-like protein [Suhomyces tanzawaensis NRRL Y-17324]|uniref:Clavaminate synthase-like protein n=1 Tax=Suhomyces tanzawaensis NRRL Y-17324 TaxID=984487 RepID=A0A1E4SFF2_9ASCO|nr:Clavaminate synthase-like protein [Suhomyces tanzawaensis NRRL Y-17324]ODV78132.1 Clavaminate synthase-like protein [Suhomyces tanzawaensis NRRL Y-17324]